MSGQKILCIMVIACCAFLGFSQGASAQQKKPAAKVAKPDTVFVIEQNEKPEPKPNYAADMKETVIVIYPNDTAPKPKVTYKDTVIVLKKGLSKEEIAAREKAKTAELMKANNFCQCVKMDIDVRPVLQLETYLTYNFIFKNTCKVD